MIPDNDHVKRDLKTANSFAKRICLSHGYIYDTEIEGIAIDALLKTYETHNDKKLNFKSWLYFNIYTGIIDEHRKIYGRKNFNTDRYFIPYETLKNSLALSTDGLESQIIAKDLLWKARNLASKKEKTVIKKYFFEDKTIKEIVREMHRTHRHMIPTQIKGRIQGFRKRIKKYAKNNTG